MTLIKHERNNCRNYIKIVLYLFQMFSFFLCLIRGGPALLITTFFSTLTKNYNPKYCDCINAIVLDYETAIYQIVYGIKIIIAIISFDNCEIESSFIKK